MKKRPTGGHARIVMPRPRNCWAGLIVISLLAGCGEHAPAGEGDTNAQPSAPNVTVARVMRDEVADRRERVGQVQAIEDVELRARIEGFLDKRLFEEGSDVEQGALLYVIEQAPYETEVARLQAELARAQAALDKARLDLTRTRELRRENNVSQADLDQAIANEAQAAADVMAREAALRQAKLNLGYTEIRAPVSGRIGRSEYSAGDLVSPDSGPLATLATLEPIHVYWGVSEQVVLDFRRRNVERARAGQPPLEVTARLQFADGTFYEHEGVWDFLDNRVDPTTGTQTARAEFPNPDKLLIPGQYVSVLVQVGEASPALLIPQSAVQEDQGGRFVLVVNNENKAEVRRVTMGARQDVRWVVEEGLSEAERVIYEGIQKVQPDQTVSPMELPIKSPTEQ